MLRTSIIEKYDDSNYPAIIEIPKKTEDTTILVLQPHFGPLDSLQYFSKKNQQKILNQKVLKYFEKSGKIIRGKKNLNKILGYELIPKHSKRGKEISQWE